MSKVEDIIAASKLSELMNKKEEDKHGKTVLWILAVVGAVAAVAGISEERSRLETDLVKERRLACFSFAISSASAWKIQ